MSAIFHELLYRPLLNILVFLYNTVSFNDLGVAIILLTVIIRIVLFPIFYKGTKNQTLLQRLQPEIKKIQEQNKSDHMKQAQEMMALYRRYKFNPMSGFYLILIQLPILIALYQVILKGFSTEALSDLYGFISTPTIIHSTFLGLIDLTKKYNIAMAVLSAALQYFQGRMSLGKMALKQDTALRVTKQMNLIMPVISVVIIYPLPAIIGLYWVTNSLLSLIQQVFINKSLKSSHHDREFGEQNKTNT